MPGSPGTKKPSVLWKHYKEQPPSDAEVAGWQREFPRINPLLLTGRLSDVIVLDQDGREGYITHVGLYHIPSTVMVQSPRGPYHEHYYYRYPCGIGKVRNFAGGYNNDLQGLDLRGDGGVAGFPGGTNSQGGPYVWKPGHSLSEVAIAPCPEWLCNYISEHNQHLIRVEQELAERREKEERERAFRSNSIVLKMRGQSPDLDKEVARMKKYADAAMRNHTEKLAAATEGRNNLLNKSAYSLAAFLNEGVWTETELEQALERAAIASGLADDPGCGLQGIRTTIRSGIRAGLRNRVTLPTSSTYTQKRVA